MNKKTIDWSSKHNILIQNPDTSFSTMDSPFFEAKKIARGTWKILSSGDYSYLVEGEKEAIAIDTGYGAGNIREFLQTLTNKPVRRVINTHHHFDHTANNGYFDQALMSEKTAPLATIPLPSFAGIQFITDYEKVIIKEGDIIDIGSRTLEIFEIPDHAVGSIALLDKKERLLFTGDEFHPHGKTLNVSLTTFVGYIKKIMAYREFIDRLCTGNGIQSVSLLDQYYICTDYILKGHEGELVTSTNHQHIEQRYDDYGRLIYDRVFPHPEDMIYNEKGTKSNQLRNMTMIGIYINYDPTKIKD